MASNCRITRDSKTENFISKAVNIHGNIYDYSLTKYFKSKDKVKIICPDHGIFEQRASNHLQSKGCPKCKSKKLQETFKLSELKLLQSFNEVHKNKYKYINLNIDNLNDKVEIVCPIHGKFEQRAADHKKGRGCIKCGHNVKADKNRKLAKDLALVRDKIRTIISVAYTKKKYSKKSKTFKILGCNWQEFKLHLENNIYNFKVTDRDMEFDHIIPVSSAKTEKQLIKLNHFTNFQLLPKVYNRWIKGTKEFNRKHFENWLKTQQSR